MPPERPANVVQDPDDSESLARVVRGLADRAEGRAVLNLTPGIGSPDDLAADLLVALGKRFDALRFERARSRAWHLVDIWYRAEHVRHLFVLGATGLNRAFRRRIEDVAGRCGFDIWLVGMGPVPLRPSLTDWTTEEFVARWAGAVPSVPTVDEAGFPEVADDGFETFRATCRRMLDPVAFTAVDRTYCVAMDETTMWLAERGPKLDRAQAANQLQSLLVSSRSASEALTRLRGAQAAYFLAGWLVPFPPPGCHSLDGIVPLGPTLDPFTARRFRRLCTPRSTAALALMLATDLRSAGLSALNMADVEEDGSSVVASDDQRFTIPVYAESLLRALVVDRLQAGARDDDPLFVQPATGERFDREQLRSVLRSLNRATAVATGLDWITRPTQTPRGWLWERRLDLQRLDLEDALVR